MTASRRKSLLRLHSVERAVAARPVREELVDEAFERFRDTGELPEQPRWAEQVILRALQPVRPQRTYDEQIEHMLERIAAFHRGDYRALPNRARECLYREAVHGECVVRDAARLVLRWAAEAGIDVTDEAFLADQDLPDYGSLGLHLMGFPDRLAKAPYEAQARRLFARLAKLRKRMECRRERWSDAFEGPLAQFLSSGQLPTDASVRDAVLVGAELETLVRHAAGHEVHELMAAFDAAARGPATARSAAVARLSVLIVQAAVG